MQKSVPVVTDDGFTALEAMTGIYLKLSPSLPQMGFPKAGRQLKVVVLLSLEVDLLIQNRLSWPNRYR